jgi:GNAT superfamily N-acetyltransferase
MADRIRRLTPEDIPAGLRLSRLANWNQLEEDWRYFTRGYAFEKAGTVVGTVAYLPFGPFTWLSMMLVDPAERRSGIGFALMEAALADLPDVCVRLDATPAGEPLYRQFGFVPEYPLCRARRTEIASGFSSAQPMESSDLSAIFTRDREVFGADRSALLTSFHRRAPEFAWISSDGQSYCFGRPGYLYGQIGPVVAATEEAARDLVSGCTTHATVAIDIPREMPEWERWLESAGFVMERPFLRMRRGENPSPGLPARQFAIAGPELG